MNTELRKMMATVYNLLILPDQLVSRLYFLNSFNY